MISEKKKHNVEAIVCTSSSNFFTSTTMFPVEYSLNNDTSKMKEIVVHQYPCVSQRDLQSI